tara:strand:+ start:136 stop:432 length:297 start_codon:yes stop_codon:yes gene_type:complete
MTPTATLHGYCPMCETRELYEFGLSVDDGQMQVFTFEKFSNADGWFSELYYYPQWFEGLIPDMMHGRNISFYSDGFEIARFPLRGSSAALQQLRDDCR